MTGVSQATVSVVLNGRSDSEVKIAPRDTRPGAPGDRGDRLRGRSGRPSPGRSAQPHHRCVHLRAGLPQRKQRLLPPVPGRHRAAGRGARLRSAAAHQRPGASTAGGASSPTTTGCGWPTAASCSAARSTATSWPSWSPTACRSSRSAGATTPAGRCPTWVPTTRPRSPSSSGAPSHWATDDWPTSARAPGRSRGSTACAASARRWPLLGPTACTCSRQGSNQPASRPEPAGASWLRPGSRPTCPSCWPR